MMSVAASVVLQALLRMWLASSCEFSVKLTTSVTRGSGAALAPQLKLWEMARITVSPCLSSLQPGRSPSLRITSFGVTAAEGVAVADRFRPVVEFLESQAVRRRAAATASAALKTTKTRIGSPEREGAAGDLF